MFKNWITKEQLIKLIIAGKIKNLRNVQLSDAKLSGVDLSSANLFKANLFGADLRGADLRGARLKYTDLAGADLSGADLKHAQMVATNLKFTNLQDADLTNAMLPKAYMCNTILRGANLYRASIDNADIRHNTSFIFAGLTNYTVILSNGKTPLIHAGCRCFTISKALEYWGNSDYAHEWTEPEEQWGMQRVYTITFLVAQARVLGWEV